MVNYLKVVLDHLENETGERPKPDDKIANLGLDSLEFVNALVEIEETLNIELSDELDFSEMTVQGLSDMVREQVEGIPE